jgi:hypothetical protein
LAPTRCKDISQQACRPIPAPILGASYRFYEGNQQGHGSGAGKAVPNIRHIVHNRQIWRELRLVAYERRVVGEQRFKVKAKNLSALRISADMVAAACRHSFPMSFKFPEKWKRWFV